MASGQGNAWFQKEISLKTKKRGFHLVTDEILSGVPEIKNMKMGICHIFVKHTSASLAVNENYDPDVREDMEMMMNKLVPQSTPFKHTCEGPDDMPAHVKACLLGSSVTVPITDGRFNLGTWQGIYLGEHRDHPRSRKLVLTIQGAPK